MAREVKMVVVDGVRYRPEDVPAGREPDEQKARTPRNKGRRAPANKGAKATDEPKTPAPTGDGQGDAGGEESPAKGSQED
jgi:hypothetical protein